METVQHPQCFIYGLVDLETRLVFYVGKTTRGMSRPRQHRKKGWDFEISILEEILNPAGPCDSLCHWIPTRNPTRINELERYWIALGRASGWPLRNGTDGGDGMRIDGAPETRARMSAAQVGKKHDEATKAKIRAAIKARMLDPSANCGIVGRVRSPREPGRKGPRFVREPLISLVGQRFGRLVIMEYVRRAGWKCRCDCGVECIAKTYALRDGRQMSCGCYQRESSSARMRARPSKTHCKSGHEMTSDNIRMRKGGRACKECDRIRSRQRKR